MDDISAKELEALKEFRERIADVRHSEHDDHILLKWLRARRFKVSDSEAMYRKSMEWRRTNKTDSLLETYTVPEVMKYWPGGIVGVDKEGRPVQVDRFGTCDIRGVASSLPREEILKTQVYRVEKTVELMKKETERQGKRVSQVVQILDMDGFGRKHMWIPGAELISDMLQTIDGNYPEMLHKTYIINAPRLFYYGFSFIKGFLSEDTRKKFNFVGGNWKAELLKAIDADELPVAYGGNKKDPDGDIYCSSLVGAGGDVPEEFYMPKEDPEREKLATSVNVKKGAKHKVPVTVQEECVIKWYLRSDRDIGFGITYKTSKDAEETVIQPVTWTHCSKHALFDTLICQESGIYTFVFDNNSSWWHDRKVKYHMEIEDAASAKRHLEERLYTTKL